MAEQSLSPTVQELAAMPENAFLELCRDTARSESASAFKEAGLDALNAAGQGALATLFALSGSPSAALGAVVSTPARALPSGEALRFSAQAERGTKHGC